jgi:hypothetical protein
MSHYQHFAGWRNWLVSNDEGFQRAAMGATLTIGLLDSAGVHTPGPSEIMPISR